MQTMPKKTASPIVNNIRAIYFAPFLVAIILLHFLPRTHAAQILGVTIHSFSSEYVSTVDQRRARSMVSESGFYGDYHTVSPRGSFWLTLPTTAGAFTNAFVTFDLGSVQPVHQMKVWNYNEAGTLTRRGIQSADILVAGEDLVFTTNLLNQPFTRAPGVFTNNFAQLIDMGGVQARYVRINVLTNYFEANDTRVGLSKVRFINTNTPPTIKLATKSFSGNRVTIKFSEPVLPSSATNAANYTIQSGLTTASISSVAMDSYSDRVVLQTSTLDTNLVYTITAQNVRDAANSISITNSTVTIAPELVLWLKADAGVTTDGSGFVTQWNDQSGAGNHAISEVDPSSQPLLVNDALNGKPVVRFDGINDGLLSPHSPSLIAEGDITFFAVIKPHSFAQYNGFLSKCGTPNSNTNYPAPFDYELAPTTGKPRLLRGNGTVATILNGTSNAVVGETFIVEMVVKGTNAMSYLNGYPNGNATFADGIEDLGSPVRIGRRESNDLFCNADIPEIMLIRGAVTESERLSIDDYLGRKYGVATANIGAPVIRSQPTNVTTYVGETASFSVGLTNGALPRSLQWFRSPNTLMTGETNSSLAISNLTLAQHNTSYYLVATNIDGSVQSDTATLTVLALTPPFITTQPVSQTVYLHQKATFTAAAAGSSQLSYQWKLGTAAIPGATNTTLAVTDASQAKAGNYSLTVSNAFGITNSDPATLTVIIPETGTYPAAVLDANPLVYYRFSDIAPEATNTFNFGNLGATHSGTYQGTFTPVGGPLPPTFPFEETNTAYNDETLVAGGVQIPAFGMSTNAGARATFAAWVYKDFMQAAHAGVIFTRATGQTCGLGVDLLLGVNSVEYHWNDLYSGFDSGLVVPNSQWTFIALVVEPTQAIVYMNDGSGLQSATNVAAHTVRPVFNAGYVGWDPFNANRRWFGSIDEPMIFDRSLSAEEISALYSGTLIPDPLHISISRSGNNVTLSWPNGVLQQSDEVGGTYQDMVGITSPHILAPGEDMKFYRIKVVTP